MVRRRMGLIAIALPVLVALAAVSTGCGSGGFVPPQPWRALASGHVSGAHPVKHLLGVYRLDSDVKLALDLSGPPNPPVSLRLEVHGVSNGEGWSMAVPPQRDPSGYPHALGVTDVRPGTYRVYLVQRFAKGRGPGFDIAYTLYTRPVPSPVPLAGL